MDFRESLEERYSQFTAQLPESLQVHLQGLDPLGVLISALVVLISLLYAIGLFRGRKSKGLVLLAGPCNAGKTTLFNRLSSRPDDLGTVASMQENDSVCTLTSETKKVSRTVRILDLPGHHALRHKLDGYLTEASGIVYVVDSTDRLYQNVEAAELLYELLVHPVTVRRRLNVLIACNKADDEQKAFSKEAVKKALEKHLETMKKTKTASVGQSSGSSVVGLGPLNKTFDFSAARARVRFTEMSAKERNFREVVDFIMDCSR